MRPLASLAWRSLLARPLRSLLTATGVALGVAVLFASLTAGAAMDHAVDRAASDEMGRATLRVSALGEAGLSASSVDAVEGTSGVAVAAPALQRRTYLTTGLDETVRNNGALPTPVTVLGIDPERETQLHDLPRADGVGLSPNLERSALVTQTLAGQEGLSVGDSVTLNGAPAPGPQTYRIVGILVGDGPVPEAAGRVVILPLGAAQTLFATSGVSRIDVSARAGTSTDELIGQLEARLQTEPYLLATRADVADSLRSSTADFRGALLLVAAVVLFVGAFLIFNTLSMTVGERVREVGLLRAAGTTRRQLMAFVLFQALVLGVAGSIAGIAAGFVLAAIGVSWVGSTGTAAVDGLSVSVGGIAVAALVGLLVTLAAALEPAWRASRITPVEALRRGAGSRASSVARLRWLVGVFGALALAALVVWPNGASSGPSGGGSDAVGSSGGSSGPIALGSIVWGPLGVYALLLGAVLVLPLVLGPLLRLAGVPFRVFRTQERLARSSLARDPSRTVLTAGALVVGLAMVVALATAAQNVRQAGASWLAETIPGSEVLTSIRPVAQSEPTRADLAAIPGVAAVSPIALFGAPLDGVRQDAAAVVGADLLADGRLSFVAGDRATALAALDRGGSVILPRGLADRIGAKVGDELEFATGPTPTRLRVAGVVAHTLPGASQETLLVGWGDAVAAFDVQGADLFAVRYDAGQEASARPALDRLARETALEPSDLGQVQGAIGDALERVFGLLDALALAAVLVAALGVVNTLSMSVLERVREIGVLRATGMTSRQVSGMVIVEAGVLGVAGALVGCLVGLVVGALLVEWSSGGFGVAIELPWMSLALAACFGVLVSVAASIYPALLASRVSIVRAVQYE